jgi:hypothetical protein
MRDVIDAIAIIVGPRESSIVDPIRGDIRETAKIPIECMAVLLRRRERREPICAQFQGWSEVARI